MLDVIMTSVGNVTSQIGWNYGNFCVYSITMLNITKNLMSLKYLPLLFQKVPWSLSLILLTWRIWWAH